MATDAEQSVTLFLSILRGSGEATRVDRAVEALWARYFGQLVALAEVRLRRLANAGGGLNAAEDVALSAFKSFCKRAAAGKFPRLADRHDLWKLLLTITVRKVAREYRQTRPTVPLGDALEQVADREPTPEFAGQVADECRRLLEKLDDPLLASIALMKMEGYTNKEIAAINDLSVASIERKLKRIRASWSDCVPE